MEGLEPVSLCCARERVTVVFLAFLVFSLFFYFFLCQETGHFARPLLFLLHTFSWAPKFCANSCFCCCCCIFLLPFGFVFLAANCFSDRSQFYRSENIQSMFSGSFLFGPPPPPLSEAALLSGAWSSCSYNKSLLSFWLFFPFGNCSFVSS